MSVFQILLASGYVARAAELFNNAFSDKSDCK